MSNAWGKNTMQARISSLHANTESKAQRNAEKVAGFISAGMVQEPTNRAYRRHQEKIAKRERSK